MSNYYLDESESSPSDTGYSSLGNFSQLELETDTTKSISDQPESINSSIFELDDELGSNSTLTCYGLPTELAYAHKEIVYLRKKLANVELTTWDLTRKLHALSLENECLKNRNYNLDKENKNLKIDVKTYEVDLNLKKASITSLKEQIIQQNCKIETINHKELISNCYLGSIQKELDIQKKSNEFYLKQIISLHDVRNSLEKKLIELESTPHIIISQKIETNYPKFETKINCTKIIKKPNFSLITKLKQKYYRQYKSELSILRKLIYRNKQVSKCNDRKLRNLQNQLLTWKRISKEQNYSLDTLRKSHSQICTEYLDSVNKVKNIEQTLTNIRNDNTKLLLKLDATNRERIEVNKTVNVLKNDFNKLIAKLSTKTNENNYNNAQSDLSTKIPKATESETIHADNISNDNLSYMLPKLRVEKTLIDDQILLIDFFYKFIHLIVIDFNKANIFLTKLFTNEFSNFKETLIYCQQSQFYLNYQGNGCKCKNIKHRIILKKKYLSKKTMYQRIIKLLQKTNKNLKDNEQILVMKLKTLEQEQLKYERRFTEIANFIMTLRTRYEVMDPIESSTDKSTSDILNHIIFNKFEDILLSLFQNILQKIIDLRNYIKILRIEINSVTEDKISHQQYGLNLKAALEGALVHNKKLVERVLQDLENRNYLCLNMIEIFKLDELTSTSLINKFSKLNNNYLEDLKNTINEIKTNLESIESRIKTKCC